MKRIAVPVAVLAAAMIFTSSCSGPFASAGARIRAALSAETVQASAEADMAPEAAVSPSPAITPAVTPAPTPLPTPSPAPTPVPTPAPYEGQLVADYALQYDGYKYNYGGEDPETGFDCSGFVYYVYKHFGYRLNRVAEDQARNGEPVEEIEDLLPGDVICFSWITSNYINHVGIYIGDGKFIHAMDSANDVLITSLEEYLETHRWKGRRIIGAMEKKTAARIEAEERQDAEALALMMAEQERLEAERKAQEAASAYTPPPAYIPETSGGLTEEEEAEKHRQEIEEAWREIWEEESQEDEIAPQPAPDDPAPIQEPAQPQEPAAPQEPSQQQEPVQPQEPLQPQEPAQPQEPIQPQESVSLEEHSALQDSSAEEVNIIIN